VHDAMVMRLVLRWQITNKAMDMLVRRFPAVIALQVKAGYDKGRVKGAALTDKGVRAVTSYLPALTSLDLTWCKRLTDKGMLAVSCTGLTSLTLNYCGKLTDEALRAVSNMPALTFLDLSGCDMLTDEGMRAVSNMPALTFLDLSGCGKLTDEGMRVVSNLPALTSLFLWGCDMVTDEGVESSQQPACAQVSQSLRHRADGRRDASSEQLH
jgi:hypothetical protein